MKNLENKLDDSKRNLASEVAKHLIPGYTTIKATEYAACLGISSEFLASMLITLGVFVDGGKIAGYIYLGRIIYNNFG